MSHTLTPDGARRLRAVRDHIVAHPETFDWSSWCGTRCCIAGHLVKQAWAANRAGIKMGSESARELLGFEDEDAGSTFDLFYGFNAGGEFDVDGAVRTINTFLWQVAIRLSD